MDDPTEPNVKIIMAISGKALKSNNILLIRLFPETIERVIDQLIEDGKRWGDTWRQRDVGGQEERIFAEFRNYYDQWKNAGVPIPWEKVIGNAHIAMVRESHPELLNKE